MKQSQLFIPTLKENPSDADCASHKYLYRAGFIRQNASGIYSYLPLGQRVLQKIKTIIREEMDRAGAQELLMPAIQPAELWSESGRWDVYGPELMRLKDRHGRDFALGATHEELITSIVRGDLKSYKQLPMTLYQIQTKYRDERRPRFGLLRGREFIMKDAYSFHGDTKTLDEAYETMYKAYDNIFTRCGLNFRAVIADSGAMGGKDTHEFMALAEVGEDTIAYSDTSNYAANIEMAEVTNNNSESSDEEQLNYSLFKANDDLILVIVKNDDEINDVKVKNLLNVDVIEEISIEANDVDVNNPGDKVRTIADYGVKNSTDLPDESYEDVRFIKEGDPSPDGQGTIQFARGIEIGQIFKLGPRYSKAMGASYLDENGKAQPFIMGCYGVGVSRTLSAIVEQHHDENGLIWPSTVTPYHVHVIPVNVKNDDQVSLATDIYETLAESYDVLIDDRKERAGVKFADADLIGCPIRLTAGKKAAEGILEVNIRATGESFEIKRDELLSVMQKYI